MEMHNPPHPGEVLREYMGDVDVTAFAGKVGVNRVSMSRLLNGQNGVSARMALSLARVLGTSAEMWMNLQVQYDLWQERAALRRKPRTAMGSKAPSNMGGGPKRAEAASGVRQGTATGRDLPIELTATLSGL